ncbi:MAG: hypothetical protein A2289_17840 [Deltaproteobacteria bacterium RIFOXYA12_FULL_58_15]|nr:MAG: hypothetical protein A2289_17840 [Deltaproteobacteria bacterium RIFOXYA12_FULL_58_15]
MAVLQLAFALVTIAGSFVLRRNWGRLEGRRLFPFALRLGLVLWMLVAVTVLSATVAWLGDIPFHWGAIGKILGTGALLVWPILLVPARWARLPAAAIIIGLTVLGSFDLMYSRHFGTLLPLTAGFGAGQTWAIRESIGTLVRFQDLWLLPTVLASLGIAFVLPSTLVTPDSALADNRRFALISVFALLLPGLALVGYNLNHWRTRKVLSHARMARHLGVYGTHVVDSIRLVREWWQKGNPTVGDLETVGAYVEQQLKSRPLTADGELYGVATGKSVLMVQLESVQRFVIGLEVHGQEITPYLNRLAESAAYFPHISDQTGESNTADTEYLVHNSQHPMRQGAAVFRRPDNDFVALPKLLADAGYTTVSAHPWDRGFWNRAVVHPKYGFQRSLFRRELGGVVDRVGWGSSDQAFYERMLPVVTELDRPFFVHMITLMSHHPYTFYPNARKRLDLGEIESTMLGAYLHLMHEVDYSLRDFIAALKERGGMKDTLLVIFGDHDARLQIPKQEIATAARMLGASEAVITQIGHRDPRVDFVPLFIVLPGGELEGEQQIVGGQIDVGPTLLHLLGMPQPRAFMGRPLLPGAQGFVARVDGVVLNNTHAYLSYGIDIPASGQCVSFPEQELLKPVACAGLMDRGVDQITASWKITEFNMAALINGLPNGKPSAEMGGTTR